MNKIVCLLLLPLLVVSCTAFAPNHKEAEIVRFDNSVYVRSDVEYASYLFADISAYSEIKSGATLKQTSLTMSGFVKNCKFGSLFNSPYSAVLYTTDTQIRIAYPSVHQCDVDHAYIDSYLKKVAVDAANEREKVAAKEAEEREYKNSQKYADNVIEQVGFYRAQAATCLKEGLTDYQSYTSFSENANNYAIKIAGKYYTENKMAKAERFGSDLIKSGRLRVTRDYCRAVGPKFGIYQRAG